MLCFAPSVVLRDADTGVCVQRKKYAQFGGDRTFATVRVLSPDNPMRGMWQLLWTTKRERDSRKSFPPDSLVMCQMDMGLTRG